MQLLSTLFRSLTLSALGATLYLYYYTAFCRWKWEDSEARILFLADPQIEGDAKIERQGKRGTPFLSDSPCEIDLIGNDIYFRHVYTSFVSPYSLFTRKPTHTIVLGDLFSSQWIDDREFEKRVKRYKWIFGDPRGEYDHEFINLTGNHDIGYSGDISQHRVDRWEKEFGKMNFNSWIPSIESTDNLESVKVHRLAVVNSMNVDGPAQNEQLRSETWSFLDALAEEREREDHQIPLILSTHIPLYKREGLCVDGPMTLLDEHDFIKEQNHLSQNASRFILTKLKPKFIFAGHDHEGCDVTYVIRTNEGREDSVEAYKTSDFEMRKKEILGVNTSPFFDDEGIDWFGGVDEKTWVVREVTVRSVMGEFGGNAGLFEIHRRIGSDGNEGILFRILSAIHIEYFKSLKRIFISSGFEYNYSSCPFVVNHIPWIVAVIDIVIILGWVIMWVGFGKIVRKFKAFVHHNYHQLQQKQQSLTTTQTKKMMRRNSFKFSTKNVCIM
ncbi:14779_t:CDS:2 [Acaulospora morrowiae]|uniref:14779_t:CDS:1 n=1 Tax=Acaulospora morrowiae TaxID=94023 RepID=A0A9N9G165_9GLOM|nr:14779_t:CDS:2 [Acaulospora morrowiae]